MKKRSRMSSRKSKRDFRRKAGPRSVHPRNGLGAMMRGGIRL